MENRTERIVLETPRHQIVGDLTLPKEGYRSRLSDYLNRGDVAFISLVNAEITEREASTNGAVTRPFVAVARDHVQLAYPLSDA